MKTSIIDQQKRLFKFLCRACLTFLIMSCEDFVKVGPPRAELVKETIFTADATANAAIIDIYSQLSGSGFASGDQYSVSYCGALSSDEALGYSASGAPSEAVEIQQINDNTILPNNSRLLLLWTEPYRAIFKANAVLEGLAASEGVTEPYRAQLNGEARFVRAFCYFYLVNLFGDVPLVLTTDYKVNSTIGRAPVKDVYQQIIADLIQAQVELTDKYEFSNNEKVRANKGAATALLARAYLFTRDWANAESQASMVIQNTGQYKLVTNLTEVFRTTSTEAILQFWKSTSPSDRTPFIVPATGPTFSSFRPSFANGFETGDQRASKWMGKVIVGSNTFYYPSKYISSGTPPLDYSTVLRLAEQYLIRSEAKAQQNRLIEAQTDLNVIRSRAGLGVTQANDKASLLVAIESERKAELFAEWGHRWLDLNRTGRSSQVLPAVKPKWTATAALFPIPETQLLNDPGMLGAQNPGY